jgi:hypothetical protein
MGIGKDHPLRREPVDVRGRDLATLGIEAPDIAITEVIAEDYDDVRSLACDRFRCCCCGGPDQ